MSTIIIKSNSIIFTMILNISKEKIVFHSSKYKQLSTIFTILNILLL